LAKELAGTLGKGVIQVRVVQNKEPDHFLSHFKGRFLVKKGKRDEPSNKQGFFHIRGIDAINIRAIEVTQLTKHLNSNDTFVLLTETKGFVWHGKGANSEERAMASGIAVHVSKGVSFQDIEEGNEPEEFWTLLGGKGDYTSTPQLAQGNIGSRLFQCSNASGIFRVFEIQNFSQDDLDNDDVMLLDNFHSVFVWLGSGSNDLEKRMSMETAYVSLSTSSTSTSSSSSSSSSSSLSSSSSSSYSSSHSNFPCFLIGLLEQAPCRQPKGRPHLCD
jgi:uncharacterized protein YcnI